MSSSHSAVSSIVSVPCVITTPSAPDATAAATAAPIGVPVRGRQLGAVHGEQVDDVEISAMPRPAIRSLPVRVGRATPSSSVLVAMVPPVVMMTTRLMRRLFTIAHFGMMWE